MLDIDYWLSMTMTSYTENRTVAMCVTFWLVGTSGPTLGIFQNFKLSINGVRTAQLSVLSVNFILLRLQTLLKARHLQLLLRLSYLDIWSFVQWIFCLEIAPIICADIIVLQLCCILIRLPEFRKLPDLVCRLVDNSSPLDFSRWYFVDCVWIQDKTSLERRWTFCTLLDILFIKVATRVAAHQVV